MARAPQVLIAALLAGGLPACGDPGGVSQIARTRSVKVPPYRVAPGVPDRDRFEPGSGASPHGASGTSGSQDAGLPFAWDLPEGWEEAPPAPLRDLNFKIGEEGECYLSILAGTSGRLIDNVNRWRGQMGLAPLTAEEVQALPSKSLLGRPSTFVDLRGDFKGPGMEAARRDYRMIGLILEAPMASLFVKMVGPSDLVSAEEERFQQFVDSLQLLDGTQASAPEGPRSDLAWNAPAGWTVDSERPTRLVTYRLPGDAETECYVSELPGFGGTVLDNLNRWSAQMGGPALGPSDIESLEHLEILGAPRPLLEVAGSYEDMRGQQFEDYLLYAVPCELPDRLITIKMIGPRERVAAARAEFVKFCRSLEF